MSVAPPPDKLMTAEEFLLLPDDGYERWLVEGKIWVRDHPMTYRNRIHSHVEANLAKLLGNWMDGQPEPRGLIHSGEAGFRINDGPSTIVGIDVAIASAELVARTSKDSAIYDGPPLLAVEILSPSDTHRELVARIAVLLGAGVAVVWVIDTDFRSVRVHRPGREIESFNALRELPGDPELPGFRIPVATIFSP